MSGGNSTSAPTKRAIVVKFCVTQVIGSTDGAPPELSMVRPFPGSVLKGALIDWDAVIIAILEP